MALITIRNPFKRSAVQATVSSPAMHATALGLVQHSAGRRHHARRSLNLGTVSALRANANVMSGARQDNTTASWSAIPETADSIIIRNWEPLVARSRAMALDNDYMKSFLRMCRQNIVGATGIALQAQAMDRNGQADKGANDAIETAWGVWGKRENCSVSGKLSWRAILNACVTSAAKDGEFFVQVVRGPQAGPKGFALHVLDPVRCPVNYNVGAMPDGSRIACGVRINQYGRPIGYFFFAEDNGGLGSYSYGGRPLVEIPAEDIIHGYKLDMLEQKRGLPWAASGLYRMRHLAGFEEASVVNARVSANKQAYIEWEAGHGPELDEDDVFDVQAGPGETEVLPEGARVKAVDPTYPTGEFLAFYKTQLRGMASGMGVAYNNLANDLEGVNFSSIRQGALDEREHWMEEQEWLIEALCQPVYDKWLPHSLLAGHIVVTGKPLRPERLEKYQTVAWQGRRWDWIDPQSDTAAKVNAKNNLLVSPSQIIREAGQDPSTVYREIAADIKAMREAGIDEDYIKLSMMGAAGAKAMQAPAKEAAAV